MSPAAAGPGTAGPGSTQAHPIEQRILGGIRDVPDYPVAGVMFKDITPLLADGPCFAAVVAEFAAAHRSPQTAVDVVVGIEARGFILGAPVAYHFGAGVIPVRKKGKLPYETIEEEYALEYGTATLEIHTDAVTPGERVLVVDDVLATGGTAAAAASLVERIGGKVCGIATLIELDFLHGRDKVSGYDLFTLIHY